jgi:hypothetical protein
MAEAAEKYLTDVATVVGGFVKRYENGSREVLTSDGKAIDLAVLLNTDQWREAILALTERLAAAEHQ